MSYAIQLQPPPPNTVLVLVADVAGTIEANDAYWAEKCQSIPQETPFIAVDMGTVRILYPYLKPGTSSSGSALTVRRSSTIASPLSLCIQVCSPSSVVQTFF